MQRLFDVLCPSWLLLTLAILVCIVYKDIISILIMICLGAAWLLLAIGLLMVAKRLDRLDEKSHSELEE